MIVMLIFNSHIDNEIHRSRRQVTTVKTARVQFIAVKVILKCKKRCVQWYYNFDIHFGVGRDSYELDGPGIESGGVRDIQHPSRPVLGPTQPPVQRVPGNSWGVKRPGRGVDHPPHLAPRLKKEYSFIAFYRVKFTFTMYFIKMPVNMKCQELTLNPWSTDFTNVKYKIEFLPQEKTCLHYKTLLLLSVRAMQNTKLHGIGKVQNSSVAKEFVRAVRQVK